MSQFSYWCEEVPVHIGKPSIQSLPLLILVLSTSPLTTPAPSRSPEPSLSTSALPPLIPWASFCTIHLAINHTGLRDTPPLWTPLLLQLSLVSFPRCQVSPTGGSGVSVTVHTEPTSDGLSSLHGHGPRGSKMLREVSGLCYFKGRTVGDGPGTASIPRHRPQAAVLCLPKGPLHPNRSPSASRATHPVRTPSAPAPPPGPAAAAHRSQPP